VRAPTRTLHAPARNVLIATLLTATLIIPALGLAAQTPGAKPAPPPAAPSTPPASPSTPAATPSPAPPPSTDNYSYQPEGRRDPFLSLIGVGTEGRVMMSKRGEGPGGMTVAEVSVRGTMQSQGALVAMVQGSDNKTYIMHTGDKFLDGTIKAITPQGLIIVQEVHDPLSLVKQREIRKLLRSLEDAKP
jgi:hypothetical protein